MAKIEHIKLGSTRKIEPMMNNRFRLIAKKLNEIVDAINGETSQEIVEAVKDVAETVSDAPVIETAPVTVDAAQEFNYLECDDKQELEDYGRTIGIELDKRAKVETMQKRITEHLGVDE